MSISDLFRIILTEPATNALVILTRVTFGNFGLAIILFTLIVRGATWPLTMSQLKASRAMTALQPQIQEIQKKYKDPKRRSEETMKLYREAGVNPAGCLLPMLVQFPIWIALYNSIRFALGGTPEALIDLSQRLYPWSFIRDSVPLQNHFLWMDLGKPDIVMPPLVFVSMWVQQKMTTPPQSQSANPQQQSMQTMMWMMPLMFAWFTLTVPSGLALYWVATSVVSIIMQYAYMGSGGLTWRNLISVGPSVEPERRRAPAPAPAATPAAIPADESGDGEGESEQARRRRGGRRRGRRRGHR